MSIAHRLSVGAWKWAEPFVPWKLMFSVSPFCGCGLKANQRKQNQNSSDGELELHLVIGKSGPAFFQWSILTTGPAGLDILDNSDVPSRFVRCIFDEGAVSSACFVSRETKATNHYLAILRQTHLSGVTFLEHCTTTPKPMPTIEETYRIPLSPSSCASTSSLHAHPKRYA